MDKSVSVVQSASENSDALFKRLKNQLGMILNLEKNEKDDIRSMIDMFEIYKEIYSDVMKMNGKTESQIKDFIKSLDNTQNLFINGKQYKTVSVIKLMDECNAGNTYNFIGFPVHVCGSIIDGIPSNTSHLFSTLVRKSSDGSIEPTVLNKGKRYGHGQFEGHPVPESDLKKLSDFLLSYTLNGKQKKDVKDFYSEFDDIFGKPVVYNIKSREQKTGGCYLKEVEFFMQCAYATLDKNFKEMESLGEHPKTPLPILEMHRMYVDKLLTRYDGMLTDNQKDSLNLMFSVYEINKEFLPMVRDIYNNTNDRFEQTIVPDNSLSQNQPLCKSMAKNSHPKCEEITFHNRDSSFLKQMHTFQMRGKVPENENFDKPLRTM